MKTTTIYRSLRATLIVGLLASCAAGWFIVRENVAGYTLEIAPGQTPLRFVYYCFVAGLCLNCGLAKEALRKHEFKIILCLLTVHFACTRFQDLQLSDMWATMVLSGCILGRRIPITPLAIKVCAWIFVIANLGAAVIRPSWAFFEDKTIAFWFYDRLAGVEGSPNALGFLSAVLFTVHYHLVRGKNRTALSALLLVCLILAGSKTSIIAVAVTMIAAYRGWKAPLSTALLLPFVGILYACIWTSRVLPEAFNLTGRADFWTLLLAGVASSPLIGLGPQGVRETLAGSIRQGFDPGNHAHNTALQILVEGGLIGFTAYLLFIWGIWRIASQSALGNALLLLFMIRSFSEATLPWSQVWIWFFAAIYSGLAIEHSPRIVHEAEPSNSQQQNNTPVLSGG